MTMQAAVARPRLALDPLAAFISLMDGSWLYIFAWLFARIILGQVAIFAVPHAVLLGIVELGAMLLTMYVIRRGQGDATLRVTMALSGLGMSAILAFVYTPLSAFTAIYFVPFFYTALLILGVWAAGSSRGTSPDTYERAYFHFRLGLGVIVVSVLFATLVTGSAINALWSELWGVVLFFFATGLGALALGNRETVRRESADSGLRSWGGMLGASIGLILLLGILAQAFGAGDVLSTIRNVVLSVLEVIAGILYVFVLIVTWPFTFCNIKGEATPNLAPPPSGTPEPDQLEPFRQFQRENEGYNPINIPVEWQAILITIAGVLVLSAIVYFLFRWLSSTRIQRTEAFEEEHERFGSWQLLWAQFRVWLDRLLGRFRKPDAAAEAEEYDDLAALQGRPEMAGTLSIRQIYARLLSDARKAGYPRAPQQTPSEYLRILCNALPGIKPYLETITSAYLEARYSPYPASSASVSNANEAWRHIETTGIGQTPVATP